MNVALRPLARALPRVRPLPAYRVPAEVRPWTDLTGSMTRAIARAAGRRPAVTLSYEGPDRLRGFEASALGAAVGEPVWAREIVLVVAGTDLLQARTVTPLTDPTLPMLRGLGQAPLAEVLFVNPRWRRPGAAQALAAAGGAREPTLAGRQCLWRRRGGGRLLVQEYFLPPLLTLTREVHS